MSENEDQWLLHEARFPNSTAVSMLMGLGVLMVILGALALVVLFSTENGGLFPVAISLMISGFLFYVQGKMLEVLMDVRTLLLRNTATSPRGVNDA